LEQATKDINELINQTSHQVRMKLSRRKRQEEKYINSSIDY
jgi:hypothetical protein